ncbi:MAG: hypothetical protein HYS13_20620 [Planctomycetia bacterium]|nr:hypothetical protein [Planctomycetia bacterium]
MNATVVTSPRLPKYGKHKATGQARDVIDGTTHYLGRFGSRESKERYSQVIAEWAASGGVTAGDKRPSLAVADLILAYAERCKQHYRKPDGKPTSELCLVRHAMRPLKELYSRLPAAQFSPLKLKAVRQRLIETGGRVLKDDSRRPLTRDVVNSHVGRIKRMFRWAVENELVPASVYHGLQAVAGLQHGRSNARETEPVKPVPQAFVDATLPHLSAQVATMIRLQLLTGMRPGEVCRMRTYDIENHLRMSLP